MEPETCDTKTDSLGSEDGYKTALFILFLVIVSVSTLRHLKILLDVYGCVGNLQVSFRTLLVDIYDILPGGLIRMYMS